MAVPSTGTLSLGQIRQELETNNYAGGVYTAAATALDTAENGSYKTINICSTFYPLSANPANMSEWYGYDHDAPCNFATASYFFDGGIDETDELVSSGSLRNSPWDKLQADLQDKWTLSMWVKPDMMLPEIDGDPGYQRYYGLWWIEDQDNGYFANIDYDPQDVNSSGFNDLRFTISTGFGSTNFRMWTVQLDNPADNGNTTLVNDGVNWSAMNPGDTNGNGFINLVFVYDDTQPIDEDKFVVYWNGTLLLTNTFGTGGGGSGPSTIPYSGNQFAHFGRGPIGGNGVSTDESSWYGYMAWISYANGYAAPSGDVTILYNGGTTPTQTDVTNLNANMILYELGVNKTPQTNFGGSTTLHVITADHSTAEFP